MQTKATRAKTRMAKLAATLVLAGGLLAGTTAATAAGFNAPQFETLDGGSGRGGGTVFARWELKMPAAETKAPTGIWRGGRYVGFLPE